MPTIPILIQDSHAGSFYFLAEQINYEAKHRLILFDAHSDATAAYDSDGINGTLLAHAPSDKKFFFDQWKEKGVIQPYNWVEPLMPLPFSQVTWVPATTLSLKEANKKRLAVSEELSSFQEILPRKRGKIVPLYTMSDFRLLKKQPDGPLPLAVSVDLDFFAGMSDTAAEKSFAAVWDYIASRKNLQAVTFAISRPYLKSDTQADFLVRLALKHAAEITNSAIYFEPFAQTGPDRTLLAKALAKKGLPLPRYLVENAPMETKSLILRLRHRITVTEEKGRWTELLDLWKESSSIPSLKTSGGLVRDNESGHCTALKDSSYAVEILCPAPFQGTKWYVLEPGAGSYTLLEGKGGFAEKSGGAVYFKEKRLAHADGRVNLKTGDLAPLFDRKTGCGTIRLFAEVKCSGQWLRTETLVLSLRESDAYTGLLTEIFCLPYIFGGYMVTEKTKQAAEAKLGTDCANFIIYGKRRQGVMIPYGNPAQLTKYLAPLADHITLKGGIARTGKEIVPLDGTMIPQGLIFHFGSHVAALYRDNPPLGVLDAGDLTIHHLEGFAEIVPLGSLKGAKRPFALMKFIDAK